MKVIGNDMWTAVAEATRPLQPPETDKRQALDRVVAAIDRARGSGLDSAEMAEVRGVALVALSDGQRKVMVSAMAKIYGTALIERAKLQF
ncbi:MAG: hypothetical protein JO306_12530 [Gemmatimonadetes bacterium]|nr:hypothetical protein [Gemmatimonadota bacterium]